MDISRHLGDRHNNFFLEEANNERINKYKFEHLKDSAKCSVCNLYFFKIKKN